jgi:hypothetical protein
MHTVTLILLLIAAACFGIEAFWHRSLIALGLFAWVLVPLLATIT